MSSPKLKHAVSTIQVKRLAYSKFLIFQAKKFLENNTSENLYNIAVILFANSVEIAIQTMAFCLYGRDRTKEPIGGVLSTLKKDFEIDTFVFEKTIEARNAIYHKANFHTWNTCKEIEAQVELTLKTNFRDILDINYDSLSLVDLIVDENIRNSLKSAEQNIIGKKVTDAVIFSCKGFAFLESRIKERNYFFGRRITSNLVWGTKISWSQFKKKYIDEPSFPVGEIFSKHIDEQVNNKLLNFVRQFDLMMMMGSNYEDYKRFLSLAPVYHILQGGVVKVSEENVNAMNYTYAQAEFIFDFVLRTVLDIESKLQPVEIRSLDKKVIKVIK